MPSNITGTSTISLPGSAITSDASSVNMSEFDKTDSNANKRKKSVSIEVSSDTTQSLFKKAATKLTSVVTEQLPRFSGSAMTDAVAAVGIGFIRDAHANLHTRAMDAGKGALTSVPIELATNTEAGKVTMHKLTGFLGSKLAYPATKIVVASAYGATTGVIQSAWTKDFGSITSSTFQAGAQEIVAQTLNGLFETGCGKAVSLYERYGAQKVVLPR